MIPRFVRSLPAALLLAVALGACNGDSGGPPVPARVDVVSGNDQSVPAGTQPTQPLVVKVVDERGRPVPGVQVTWTASVAGDGVAPNPSTTDAQGQATAQWTLGNTLGPHTVTASVAGATAAQFTAMRVVGSAAAVQVVSGNNQNLATGAQAQPLVVRVVDAAGNPVAGVQVTFASSAAGDAVAPNPATTNAQGQASVQWTPGAAKGARTLTATAPGGLGTTFTERAGAVAVALRLASGNDQTGVRGKALPAQLVVQAVDSTGTQVAGARVEWYYLNSEFAGGTLSTTGVSPAVSTTDVDGMARTTWTLATNDVRNQQTALAILSGPGATVVFRAMPIRPAAATVSLAPVPTLPCCGDTTTVTVVVRDSSGNQIPDAPVAASATPDTVVAVLFTHPLIVRTVFPGTTTLTAASGAATGSTQVTVSPAGPGPVLQVYNPRTTLNSAGQTLGFFRGQTPSGAWYMNPEFHDLHLRNVGASGTISGLAVAVEYTSGDTGWLMMSLSSTTAPALLHLAVSPDFALTQPSTAKLTISSTTPGVPPVTVYVAFNAMYYSR